jgi:hypothetical protein
MIGVEIPPAEELMPGPCDFSGLDERSRVDEVPAAATA